MDRAGGLFSIGPFSRVSGLSVKTVRLYHEKGLLEPSLVDPGSGYRYFTGRDVERARLIVRLRQLEFSLSEIGRMLEQQGDAGGTLPFLEEQRRRIDDRQARLAGVSRELDGMIREEREALARARDARYDVEERRLPELLVGGLRWTGSYDESGAAIGRVIRRFRRDAFGPPLNLYFELEYKDGDADLESCVALRVGREGTAALQAAPPFVVHTLPAAPAVCLLHQGPYSELDRSYARVLAHVEERRLRPLPPTREVYHKGPGLLLRGDPRDYRTEIQVPVASDG